MGNSIPKELEARDFSRVSVHVSDKYNELSKQREDLWKKCQRTDSKKEEFELRNQVKKLDDQINDFYELGEWRENNNV